MGRLQKPKLLRSLLRCQRICAQCTLVERDLHYLILCTDRGYANGCKESSEKLRRPHHAHLQNINSTCSDLNGLFVVQHGHALASSVSICLDLFDPGMILIACFLFIRYAIAPFDSHYPGQRSSAQQIHGRALLFTLHQHVLGTDVDQCARRDASNSCSIRPVTCRPAQRLFSAPPHVQLLSNVRHSKFVATTCVSHSGAFTADQVSQKNKDACMQSFCPRLVDLLLALCRQPSVAG